MSLEPRTPIAVTIRFNLNEELSKRSRDCVIDEWQDPDDSDGGFGNDIVVAFFSVDELKPYELTGNGVRDHSEEIGISAILKAFEPCRSALEDALRESFSRLEKITAGE